LPGFRLKFVLRLGLIPLLFLFQDGDAELLSRLAPIVDRACDLDAEVRAEAVEDAGRLCRENGEALAALAQKKKTPALIVMALAGKLEGAALFKVPDRTARRVACELLTPGKEQLPELLRIVEGKDLGARLAAARALGRIEDPALRQMVSSALGQGMRWAGGTDLLFKLISSLWRGNGAPQNFLAGDPEPERASLALATLANVPNLVVTEGFAPSLARALDNDRVDRASRSLLIRSLGRSSPSILCPLLALRDRKLRGEIMDVLDRSLTDPLAAPAVYEAWRDAKERKLDDGRAPPQLLSARLEGVLQRLCGESGTPDRFAAWLRSTYRSHVDRRADAAIQRGVAGLRKAYDREMTDRTGSANPLALSALSAYALLKCDVPPDDPAITRALDLLIERDPEGIYTISLAAMALATALEKGAPRREKLEKRLRRMAEVLVESQLRSGGWSYATRAYADQSLSGWTYDISNTQFAVLGLRAAANAGAKIPRKTWERTLALLERAQMSDGGWSYQGEGGSTDSRSAAGAYCWIICAISIDEKLAPEVAAENARLRGAVQWLGRSADSKTLSSPPDYYLLYSLERLFMIAKIERLGTRDWYADGASLLVRSQSREGIWSGGFSPTVDTAMALLFLRKAFIARPDIATESAHRATEEQAQDVYARHGEALFQPGVKEIRVAGDKSGWFILVVADSETSATTLKGELSREIDGVPLRIAVE
jgi:hypothetical protein